MSSQSNTPSGGADPRLVMREIKRLATEKCELAGTSSVPEIKAQQIREINEESSYRLNWFCIKRLDADDE